MTGPGGSAADRAAREQLAREARATATTLLDWVGTRVDGVATARAAGASRPRQSAGPCTWCPVCTLVAALRGEQPELTAHLAEQASALLVVLRLLLQSHAHEHPVQEHPFPTTGAPAAPDPTATGPAHDEAEEPGDVPAHARFDPEPAPSAPASDEPPRPAPDRPTGKRGPRPSPRPRPTGAPAPTAAPEPAPTTPAPSAPGPATRTPTPAAARSTRGVQRIPVRRRTRPC